MDEESKQQAIRGRDCFNEWISSLRDEYPNIKNIQDVMNRDINIEIYRPLNSSGISKSVICSCYDLMTADGDWEKWLEKIAHIGANGTRFFALQCFGQKDFMNPFQPFEIIPGKIHRGFPVFDLLKWNPDWWKKYRQILRKMKSLNLEADIVGETYTDLKKTGDEKYKHPFYNSIQAFATPGGVWGEPMKRFRRRLYHRLIKTALRIGVPFRFEGMNEYDAKAWDDKYMIEYHKWMVDEIRKSGAKVVIASAMRNYEAIKEQVDFYSIHGCVTPKSIDGAYKRYGSKGYIISGDGGFDGHGPRDAKGRRGASPKEMRGIVRKMYKYGYVELEYFDRGLYRQNNDRANLDDFHIKPLKSLIDECRKIEKTVSR